MSSEALSVFVDANILIYSEDSADPAKQKAAIDWLGVLWQRGVGRLSTQVLNEFYVIATRKISPMIELIGDICGTTPAGNWLVTAPSRSETCWRLR